VTGARYRLVHGDGRPDEDGQGDVRVGVGSLVLTLAGDDVLQIPFGHITGAGPADGYAVRIALADGAVLELTQLGRMRTQLLAELRDGQAALAAAGTAAVGDGELFRAQVGGAGGAVEVRVYEDALSVPGPGPGGAERIGFSFVGDIAVADYTVTVTGPGRAPLVLSGLGRRTSELAGLLSARRAAARARTSALLAALLPGLGPDLLRRVAGELRDGVAVPMTELDTIAPAVGGTLLRLVTRPARRDEVAELGRRTELAIGFRQVGSVRRAAVGTTGWRDSAVTPHIGDHGSWTGGGFGAFGWGFGWYGGNADWWRPMTARAGLERGQLAPASADLGALTTAGPEPTVLAFALGRAGDRVVFDVISQAGLGTYVYRAAGADGFARVNRELDNVGFRPPGAGGGAGGPLAEMLVGRVEPGADWAARLGELLGGAGPAGGGPGTVGG